MEKTTLSMYFGVSITIISDKYTIYAVHLSEKPLPERGSRLLIETFREYERTGEISSVQLRLSTERTTPFQQKVYRCVTEIPAGETRTYGEISKKLRTSPRAVGQALKKNPFPILIPCHRVISEKGLGGFSCGIDIKKKLIGFERGKKHVL